MSALDRYIQAKCKLTKFEEWAAMLGKEGHCGEAGRLHDITFVNIDICYQQNEGTKNYHIIPPDFLAYVRDAIRAHSLLIITTALTLAEKDVLELAKEAESEAREVLRVIEERKKS